jgi:hypothetical protein
VLKNSRNDKVREDKKGRAGEKKNKRKNLKANEIRSRKACH